MVTILDRYIFRNVVVASLGAVAVFGFVLLLGNVVKDLLRALAAEQISTLTFAQLVLILVPYVFSYALPIGVLTGILLVLGRLSAQHEITAMRSMGWGLARIGAPVLAVAVCGALAALVFDTQIGPRAMGRYRQTLADAVRKNPLSFIVPREFVRNFPGYVIYVAEKEGSSIRGVWLWQLDKQGRTTEVIRGDRGTCAFKEQTQELTIHLDHASVETRPAENPEATPVTGNWTPLGQASNISFALPLEQLLGRKTYRRNLSLLTRSELKAELARTTENPDHVSPEDVKRRSAAIRYAMQEQFVMATAVLALAVVGVPLGIKLQRRETSANLALALVLALGFYFILIVIDWAQNRPDLRPDLLLWIPNILYGALGLWLFRKVDRQ